MNSFVGCLCILTLSSAAHADTPKTSGAAQSLYAALAVPEISDGDLKLSWMNKSVGGLTCMKFLDPSSDAQPIFTCSIDATQPQDNASIYKALRVKPVAMDSGTLESTAAKKSVGALTCTARRATFQRARAYYDCVLQ